MGVRRSAALGVLAALMALASPAAAAGSSPSDEQVRATGSVVYTWHGDPARGCAQLGVCGIHGALVIQPQAEADVLGFGPSGGVLELFGASETVRVQGGDLGPGGACVDQLENDGSSMDLRALSGGAVAAGFDDGSISSGHCAGPLAQDLAGLLIRGHRSRARYPTYDLRGSLPFAAGPFSGELESTLLLRPHPSPSFGGGGSFSSSGGGSSGPAPHKVLVEEVDLRYRVSAPAGAFSYSFAGGPAAFCRALNSCGAHGSLSLAFPRLTREVQIVAARTVKRRVDRRQALRDFRAGTLPIFGGPPVSWVAPQLTETFIDAGTCTDSVPVPELGLGFGSFTSGGTPNLHVAVAGLGGRDPLRTHCPGPEAADALSGSGVLASARVPRRRLLDPRWSFPLQAEGVFGGPGYVGGRNGRLTVTMSLQKVIAGTRREEG